jgi:hypothetical protein
MTTASAIATSATDADHAGADPAEDKRFASLRAELALHGIALYELAGGTYLACAAASARHCADLREAAALLRQMAAH